MAKSKNGSDKPIARQQLRGEALQVRIEAVIREAASAAARSGKSYRYNASDISRRVPTTRKSLAKHEELVARVLQDLDARRRMVTGEATVEHLRDHVAYLREQVSIRDQMIAALRAHHIDIYKRFHEHSLEAELLIRPILHKESAELGACILCGTTPFPSSMKKQESNVVNMRRRASEPDAR
ncbi:MAG: hypothetical protein O9303_08315 [Silanimonas sp.]|nr:hypothetical protein [Silanimonas sp.]